MPPNSLAMRSSHPALAMWWEEMRRAEARQDVRSELFALKMVLILSVGAVGGGSR